MKRLLACLVALSAWATDATCGEQGVPTPGSRQPPSYIPRSVLFSPPEVLAVKISPDATHLAYVKGEPSGAMNVHVCPTRKCGEHGSLRQLTHFPAPEIYRFFWTGNSRSIVFLRDTNGTKLYDLYSLDISSGRLVNHTKNFSNTTAKIFKVSGAKVALGINDRNPKYHDVFILDTSSGSLERIFENDKFSGFTFDDELRIAFKDEIHDDGAVDVHRGDAVAFHFTPEQAFHSRLLGVHGASLYYLDSRISNTTELRELDLASGQERVLANDPKSDIGDTVFVDGRPAFYSTTWLKKEWHSLGPKGLAPLHNALGGAFEIVSQSQEAWVARVSEPQRIGASFYLYRTKTGEVTPLFVGRTDPRLAAMLPFEFQARDGLTLTAYLTLPTPHESIEALGKPLPLVVIPHGGPFQVRDRWAFNPYHQWLASRGYAVLSVNFRLSSGLGNQLVNAGNGEWGRKALFDLIDAVRWCVERKITAPGQVGIMGESYGGYAALAALTFTPREFAVGIDVVGPSSLVTVMQKVPKYWDFPQYQLSDAELFFTRGAFIKSMGGSPDDPEGAKFLESRSPLHFARQIERPLLIVQGDNDPIVTKEESRQIFEELKRLKKKALYLSFSNEGHQFRHYANIDTYLAHAEKWLHDVLGGRFEPASPGSLKESTIRIQRSE